MFSDIQPKLVTVHGRNLLRIFRLHQPAADAVDSPRRIGISGRWMASPDNEPFITRIEVEDWKRKPEQAEELAEALDVHQA